ncbi:hypothetical protein [Halomonas sp. H10-9-1]|uniref:hypothetical protein n=1 Tax=Halomonas sp. H10-9-1 TaxID=2950871 RepID=UPI0032DFC6B2
MHKPLMTALAVLFTALVITGCSYTPARIKSEPLIEIDDGRHHDAGHRHGGSFCPPGQAKKGRC